MGADTAGRQELVLANTKLVDGRQQDQQRSPWPYLYIFDLNGDVHVHPTKSYSNGHTYSCIASPLNWNLQHCLFSSCLVRFHPANCKGMTSQVNKLYVDSLHNRHLQNGRNHTLVPAHKSDRARICQYVLPPSALPKDHRARNCCIIYLQDDACKG